MYKKIESLVPRNWNTVYIRVYMGCNTTSSRLIITLCYLPFNRATLTLWLKFARLVALHFKTITRTVYIYIYNNHIFLTCILIHVIKVHGIRVAK